MAFDFSKLNFFNKLDARARIAVLFGAIIGVGAGMYLLVSMFSGGPTTIGPSRVAEAPQGLQSVPGSSNLSAEYQRALVEANRQVAQSAQMTGSSAVPTLINFSNQQAAPTTGNCNIICSDDFANVKYSLDDWVKQGKMSAEVSADLQQLANKNVTVTEYSDHLNQLVKDGKITPEQARELLEQYKKQYKNGLLQESAKEMDGLLKAGKVPLDAANELLTMQKNNASSSDYAARLQELVRQGKLLPEIAQQLLAQYTQQRARDIINGSIAVLRQMAKNGEIVADVEKDLIELESRMVPMDEFAAALKKHMDAGKLIPIVSNKIMEEYKEQKAAIGPTGAISQLVQQAEQAAYDEINDLMRTGQMTPDVGKLLTGLIQKNVPFEQFVATINQLVQEKKLTVEISKLKIADYKAVSGLRKMADKLTTMQANNASSMDLSEELKSNVQRGLITPDQAAELMRQYDASSAQGVKRPVSTGSTEAFAQLQQRLEQGQGAQNVATAEQFAAAAAPETISEEDAQLQQARTNATINAMGDQAKQLINAWQSPTMLHKDKVEDASKAGEDASNNVAGNTTSTTNSSSTAAANSAPALIKAGEIMFAVLDTAANSDYPDSPIMATIVDGPMKGAKLLGKLTTTKGVSGQLDRISLNFTLMNQDAWPKSKPVTAYAIDPDTARTVLASHVDYHYLQRFGAIMATSFVQGYSNAISSSASTTTTGIFGTSTTHPELSASQKLATGLGQIGQALGSVTQNYVNIPPTVKVDSGVGLGILFMSDVT